MLKNELNENQPAAENDVFRYPGILMRRKWTVITFFVVLVTMVTMATLKTAPVYRAATRLLIEQEHTNMFYSEGVMVDISGRDYYQTQYKILKSRTLAKQVFETLKLDRNPEFSSKGGDSISVLLKHISIEPVRDSRLVDVNVESHSPVLAAQIANTLAGLYVKRNMESALFASRELLKKLPESATARRVLDDQYIVDSLPSVVNSPLLQELKKELSKNEASYADLSERYKGEHPLMLSMKATIDQLNARIDRETKNILESVRNDLSGYFKSNNVRIIDTAEVPSVPVRPQVKLNILLACMIGIILGCGLAFVIEYFDTTIKTGKEIEQFMQAPFLGGMPRMKANRKAVHSVMEQQTSAAAESIKLIRTNVLFSAPDANPKTLLVTSAIGGEGKTFVSLNLAVALAQCGEQIVLVDSDLRRSSLTRIMKREKAKGLSNYIIGECPFEEIVYETAVKNLFLIPAGHRSPNPSELLAHGRMKEFIENAKRRFTRVIFDTSPVLPISDTLNFAHLVDGAIQVVQYGKMNRNILSYSKQNLQNVGSRVIGVVLNNINAESGGYYGYDYGYRYGYNYGYGKSVSNTSPEEGATV